MSDLISRQAAIAVADSSDYVGLSVDDVKKVTDEVVKGLKRLPSAQPEIIRCRDCKWFDEQEVCNKNFMVIMDPNFFCADGEVATVKDGENKDSGDVKC